LVGDGPFPSVVVYIEAFGDCGRYTMTVFPDVGYGFFREDRESYNAAATQAAWDATLAFFAENPGG
jgi:dienelactone hydrolase